MATKLDVLGTEQIQPQSTFDSILSENMKDVADELSIAPARAVAQDAGVTAETLLKSNLHEADNGLPVRLQPGYMRLIGRGSAPYLNDVKNTKSYFAELVDKDGKSQTLWGVDLERSLDNTGAKIGDAISVSRNGHRVVEIDERQEDGSIVKTTAKRMQWDTAFQPISVEHPLESRALENSGADASSAAIEGPTVTNRFAVMAPYWLNGLHNVEGIALAEKLNKLIQAQKLEEDSEAIAKLLSIYSNAESLGLEIVSSAQHANDRRLKANTAQPRMLLGGALVRDKEGAYRPVSGGSSVLQDKGDSIVLKNKSAEAYRGAMELALAKGWTAIELKGKPGVLAEAWLEAKLLNLDVVNFSPSEQDKAKFAVRLAEELARKAVGPANTVSEEQTPEIVEVRPFVDITGQTKLATVTYTVTFRGGEDARFSNPGDAARAFGALAHASSPVVIRSVTRADGLVHDHVVAGFDMGPIKGKSNAILERMEDREFDSAMDELIEEMNAVASLNTNRVVAIDGNYIGPIISIEGQLLAQKIGRDPNKVVWHDLSKLKGQMPKAGEVAEIGYAKGVGFINAKNHAHELDGSGRSVER